jgi:hypothetical protein
MWFLIIWIATSNQIEIQGIIQTPNIQTCLEMQNNVHSRLPDNIPVIASCVRIEPPRIS